MVLTMLNEVQAPGDLIGLAPAELAAVAADIRQVIIESVERHGGHLGSNLGAVELTIALHRVFRSPHDILLWDTGHQTYPHKILTGRRGGFDDLRQRGGLSGYPSRDESEHDWIENSHASTVLSYAHGIATAQASQVGEGRRVVAVIGDGALTGGMAYEGLNNLGNSGTDCIVVLNDNGRSYAPTASRLGAGLLRMHPGRRGDPEIAIDLTGAGGEPPEFFETLGLRYSGPIDGHDIAAIERALLDASGRSGPQVIHVLTQKGRGHAAAEQDQVKRLHDTSVAKPGSYTVTFGETLLALAADDPRLVAITAAMPDSTGLLDFARLHPARCIDVGIAEQHAVTAAAGMAMGGLVPILAVYSTFLTRAIDQVVYDVGLHGLPVIFCLDRAGITGDDGASHHGLLDMVLLSKVPGITMFAPASLEELPVMLREAVAIVTGPTPGPVAIRWSKTLPPRAAAAEVGHGTAARLVRAGEDVCLIGIGKGLEAANEAATLLEHHGVAATVWDPRCIRPLDPVMLADAARHPYVVTVEDGLREGGIGTQVADRLASLTAGWPSTPRVEVLGTPCAFLAHGTPDQVRSAVGLDGPGVAASALALINARSLDTVGAHP